MTYTDDQIKDLWNDYRAEYRNWGADGLTARRKVVLDGKAQLEGYARRSRTQDDELVRLDAELTVLDTLIGDREVATRNAKAAERAEKIAEITRAAQDPANLEGPDSGSNAIGAPALVRQPGTRLESAAETVSRSNPWRDPDRGPLIHETAQGFVSRAHTAIETVSERLGHDGAELLATLLSERRDSSLVSVRRSADEVRQGAEMILALSSPYYESAMRAVFRNPDLFRTGIGAMIWSDDEREAVGAVMNNELVRAAFAESSGATGAFALPLQLDGTILFTNAGIASPHRNLARHELMTSNTWNGVTSAGATASFVAEGVAVTDSTPAIGALVLTAYKIMTYVSGSFEVLDDTTLSEQVPRLFDDARTRLEGSTFAIGTGSSQPFGVVTRAGADASAGALTNTMIYNLHQNLPPRFRNGGRLAWAANVSIMNVARQVLKATGTVETIVNDNTPDGIPEMLGIDFYESSAMLGGSVGNRELVLGAWDAYIIADRLPQVVLAEPLVMSQATALPTGQRGWLAYSRVAADTVTQGAAFGSNAFVVHVH
jgi:HK97 family phage major capsid protein